MGANNPTRRIVLEVDRPDYEAILDAVAKYQADHHAAFGETILPDGEGDLRGRIVAEICRGWCELVDWRPTREGGA